MWSENNMRQHSGAPYAQRVIYFGYILSCLEYHSSWHRQPPVLWRSRDLRVQQRLDLADQTPTLGRINLLTGHTIRGGIAICYNGMVVLDVTSYVGW